ncbi:MAG: POTRA domain-containing protein [Bacteroidota bacterium]|nr:POTRA domain-containing protein [Bacteroidota bacterium]
MNLCAFLTYSRIFLKVPTRAIAFALFLLTVTSAFSQTDDHLDNSKLSGQANEKRVISLITISGNKRTKEKIILRELAFKAGDSLTVKETEKRIERSKQNLINTSLFNFVTITPIYAVDSSSVVLLLDVKERWYLWPAPIFEIQDRNFNSWWQTKDMFRINYGMYLTMENVRGRNESAVLKFRKGYTELYGFSYKIPFINKKQTVGLSASYNFLRNNEVAYCTYGNRLQFNRNYKKFMRKEKEAKLGLTFRKGLYTRHFLELLYCESYVDDTIKNLNKNYFGENIGSVSYFSMQYRYKRDYRDAKIFPLRGYYYELSLVKDGLNLLKNENVDNFTADAVVKNYWSPMKRFFVGTALRLRYKLFNTSGYYFNRALGYNDFVRGYEYYVVDGQTFAMLKANVNFQLVKPRVVTIPVKRLEKFNRIPYSIYLSAHADAAFVQDKVFYNDNPLSNSWLGGTGLGVSFVTYYDYVLRVEASVNKLREKGIFLHFSAPL